MPSHHPILLNTERIRFRCDGQLDPRHRAGVIDERSNAVRRAWEHEWFSGEPQGALELMGISVLRVSEPNEVEEIVSAALDAAFEAGDQVAVLLSQNLIGRKKWERD